MANIYEIRDDEGAVVNRIVADQAFVEVTYPGKWTFISEAEQQPQPPETTRIDTPLFMMRFTPQERIGIRQAAKTDPVVDDWFSLLSDPRLAYVELDDPNLLAAMGYLVGSNLLSEPRMAAVLTP